MTVTSPVAVPMDVPPYRLSGIVYGVLLNHRSALDALGNLVNDAPYRGAPRAPVLYIKPRNTLAVSGSPVRVPPEAPELEVGACLGLVLARAAARLAEGDALEYVAGYLIVNDVSVPHASYYRPSIRHKARDGFCPLGPRVVPRAALADPGAVTLRVFIDGVLRQSASTADLLRPAAQLLAEVSEFMTLAAGDVLALGAAFPAPRVRPGQVARIEIDGIGCLENPFVGDAE